MPIADAGLISCDALEPTRADWGLVICCETLEEPSRELGGLEVAAVEVQPLEEPGLGVGCDHIAEFPKELGAREVAGDHLGESSRELDGLEGAAVEADPKED
jgi:hypothetical protein